MDPAFSISVNDTIKDAVKILNKKDCRFLVVVNNSKPIGIITERDIIKRVILDCSNPQKITVQQIMSKPLFFGNPNMEIAEAAKIMLFKKINQLPILFKERLVGIINLSDVIQCKDSVEQFKGIAESASSSEMTQAMDVYFALESLCKKCPLMIEQGYPKKCRKAECMWWIGEDCAIAVLSKNSVLSKNFNKTIISS
ncbi:CBS domain-containing protein [Candidatus Bathyarchaeota archaeon]|nr:CBS domain-containing protein [Candidatus Bathyarchaeota archaeon]